MKQMDDLMLPPMPEPVRLYLNHKGTEVWGFLGVQMREYAKKAVEAERARPRTGLPMVIAGAIFDFAGFLTTRKQVIEVGSTANAAPVADLVKEWAELRGLSLDDAAVLSWQETLPLD